MQHLPAAEHDQYTEHVIRQHGMGWDERTEENRMHSVLGNKLGETGVASSVLISYT